jgi:hypothetical protein
LPFCLAARQFCAPPQNSFVVALGAWSCVLFPQKSCLNLDTPQPPTTTPTKTQHKKPTITTTNNKPKPGKPPEAYRNTFANLALPLFAMAEPIAPKPTQYRDLQWTLWDRWVIEGDVTVQVRVVKVI